MSEEQIVNGWMAMPRFMSLSLWDSERFGERVLVNVNEISLVRSVPVGDHTAFAPQCRPRSEVGSVGNCGPKKGMRYPTVIEMRHGGIGGISNDNVISVIEQPGEIESAMNRLAVEHLKCWHRSLEPVGNGPCPTESSTQGTAAMNLDKAREIAAQCWCDSRVTDRAMDAELVEVFAETLVQVTKQSRSCSTSAGGSVEVSRSNAAQQAGKTARQRVRGVLLAKALEGHQWAIEYFLNCAL